MKYLPIDLSWTADEITDAYQVDLGDLDEEDYNYDSNPFDLIESLESMMREKIRDEEGVDVDDVDLNKDGLYYEDEFHYNVVLEGDIVLEICMDEI